MTTNRTSRRAEEFDRALSGAAPRDPALAALVALAGAVAAVPQRSAPAFRDALRTKLMAEAASVLPAAAAAPAAMPAAGAGGTARALRHVLSKPAMQVATGGLAAVVAVSGVGVGASRSLPGDTLYGLKRTVEGWQVGLAGGRVAKASALLEHARTRLSEIQALLDRGDLARVAAALDDLNAELRSATARLLAAAPGSREAYDRAQAAVREFTDDLVRLYPKLPPSARSAVSVTMQTLNVTRARLAAIPVPSPKPGPTPNPTPSEQPHPTTPPATRPSVPVSTTPSVPVSGTPSVPVTHTPTVPVLTTPPSILPTSLPVSLPPVVP